MSKRYPPPCEACDGGQNGMHHDGTPRICVVCGGSGFDLGGAANLDAWLSGKQMAEADAASDATQDAPMHQDDIDAGLVF